MQAIAITSCKFFQFLVLVGNAYICQQTVVLHGGAASDGDRVQELRYAQ